MTNIDIIILSYAKNDHLRQLTEQSISTLLESEDREIINFKVLVIESNKTVAPYQFSNTTTIYPNEQFGFNKYLNIGIRSTNSPHICLCNNDLIFHKNWASEILKQFNLYPNLKSANPFCNLFEYDNFIINSSDLIIRRENLNINGILTGWCIFVERSIFSKIGLLDESFEFWYADNDYDLTLKKHKIDHALIKSSKVTHLACQSHEILGDNLELMTLGQRQVFKRKWGEKSILKKLYNFVLKKFRRVLINISQKVHL